MSEVQRYAFIDGQVHAEPLAPKWEFATRYVTAGCYSALAGKCERLTRERDAALAELAEWAPSMQKLGDENQRLRDELAALKGGREVRPLGYMNKKDIARLQDPITWDGTYLSIGVDHWAQWEEEPPYDHLQAIYTAPPAQASAWVEVSERLPELEQNVLVEFTTIHGTPQHTTATLQRISRHCGPDTPYDNRWYVTVGWGHELHTVTHWQPIAAPAPDTDGEKP